MSKASPPLIRAQTLMGRRVQDAAGKHLGRVYEIVVEPEGENLCVKGLLVGPRAWLTRFGWTRREHGREVPWEEIAALSPCITLRREVPDA